MGHVFLSYRSEDGDFVSGIIRQLEDAGFSLWADNERLRASEKWREAIDQAIRDAFAVLVVMTPEARVSEQIMYEWMFALGVGVKVIVVLKAATELHPRLETMPCVDFANAEVAPWGKLIRQMYEARDGRRPFGAFGAPRERPASPPSPSPFGQRPSSSNSSAPSSLLDRFRRREPPSFDDDDSDDLPDLDDKQHHDLDKLIEILDGEDRDARITAIRRLSEMGDKAAIPALIRVLRDEDWRLRDAAAQALGKLKAAAAVVGLLETLRMTRPGPFGGGPNNTIITNAIREIGPLAIPVLIDALEDEDFRIRLYATEILGQIGGAEGVTALTDALRDPEWRVRWRAADALGKLGDQAVVQDLCEMMRDENKDVRMSAAWALGRLGYGEAVPSLLRLLTDRDWRVRWAGAEALWCIGPEAVPALLELLREPKGPTRRVVIRALAEIGEPAIEGLLGMLRETNWDIRWAASNALQEMGERAVPPLVRALQENDWRVGWAAAEALKQIGTPEALNAVEEWRGGQESEPEEIE
jgi:HEAT repeat protein